jgi:hypothetical protein
MIQQREMGDLGVNPGLFQPDPGRAFVFAGRMSKLVQKEFCFHSQGLGSFQIILQ